jgi:hypothetical protein
MSSSCQRKASPTAPTIVIWHSTPNRKRKPSNPLDFYSPYNRPLALDTYLMLFQLPFGSVGKKRFINIDSESKPQFNDLQALKLNDSNRA